ncbi:MAG: DEAD/DEAH box helicase [Spirochaetaceae bacterium]|jgi:DNA excision repair protein ERCC-3|nr:DEAD/DEAH box helicase [Spirochaetaceae bacterium]
MSADFQDNKDAKPLIVQSDSTVLLDIHSPLADDARAAIMPFAELEKSPEHIHTYRISPLSLWNAAGAGYTSESVNAVLEKFSRYELPGGLLKSFTSVMERFGRLRLLSSGGFLGDSLGDSLLLECTDPEIYAVIEAARPLKKILHPMEKGFSLKLEDRGTVKWELIKLGWPVMDNAPLIAGEALEFSIREGTALSGLPFKLRDYQKEAAKAVLGSENGGANCAGGGYGIVALPCGAGKTMVGMALMAALKTNTLILTASVISVHQWIDELLDKTTLTRQEIAEFSGFSKSIAPVTIATYQILTWRSEKNGEFPHFNLFHARPWGLIIYDEVHLLPAPVFRITAELQAVRRLGLTATLIREDGAEDAVFSLVGPKRYDIPWKTLEHKGWIAEAFCAEVRVLLPEHLKIPYASAEKREKYRLASENPRKIEIVKHLIETHPNDHILVIGQYIKQLEEAANTLQAPLITGKTSETRRAKIYGAFKRGDVRVIVVSKVSNFAVDLPDASMAIQISGSFGSRQEEAQRLGRILRPKQRSSYFFTLVSHRTVEEDFALKRRLFLSEQGYKYTVIYWDEESQSCQEKSNFSCASPPASLLLCRLQEKGH